MAICNTYTCQLLLNAALATSTSSFEELAFAIGGHPFMIFAQVSNIILLIGNTTGDLCLLADLGSKSLASAFDPDAIPAWLTAHHGRGVMVLLTATVIFPLSLSRGMRALEHASTAGTSVVLLLFAVLTADAFGNGFRGITSGEVPLWSVNMRSGHVGEAFSLIGYSFYLHPLMMPMLREMPTGRKGVRILSDAVTLVIMGVSLVAYTWVGGMGAAAFGAHTQGDIMMNRLLAKRWASAAFGVAMLVYLASCIPPLVITLRSYVDFIVAGAHARFSLPRFVTLTAALVALPLALAWQNPSLAEKAFALTGATGVCIVCYIIPIAAHFSLMLRGAEAVHHVPSSLEAIHEPLMHVPDELREAAASAEPDAPAFVPPGRGLITIAQGEDEREEVVHYMRMPTTAQGLLFHMVFPVIVLALGCGLSGLALYSAVSQL